MLPMYSDLFDILGSLIGLVPEVIILLACIRFVRHAPGPISMLMVVGSSLTMALSIAGVAYRYLPFFNDHEGAQQYYQVLSYGFIVGGLLFMAGLFMLVLQEGASPRDTPAA